MLNEGEFKKRITVIELGQIRTFGISQISPSIVIQLLDEVRKEFPLNQQNFHVFPDTYVQDYLLMKKEDFDNIWQWFLKWFGET